MKLSLLKYFVWISLVLLALASCRSARIQSSGERAEMIRDSISSGLLNKMTFKAKIIFHENELSGLMMIKKSEDGNYKIAFYSELGMTYLEGILINPAKHGKLIIKNIIPVLNHKPFTKSLEKCMQLIFSDKENPRLHAPMPPNPHASMPLTQGYNTLIVPLRNGFILELSPQVSSD